MHSLSSFSQNLCQLLRQAKALLFDERCVVCGELLVGAKVCGLCLLKLPYTHFCGQKANLLERHFWHLPLVERANAYLWYEAGGKVAQLVHAFKYHHRPDVAQWLGRLLALDLRNTDFFDSIDCIVPVPLAAARKAQRGYNQSLYLARGIAEILPIPIVEHVVQRTVDNPSQTLLAVHERQQNVEGIFEVIDPQALCDKHLLLVDDVITLGMTMSSLVRCITHRVPTARISILAACAAGKYRHGRVTAGDLGLPNRVKRYDPRTLRLYRPQR